MFKLLKEMRGVIYELKDIKKRCHDLEEMNSRVVKCETCKCFLY